MPHTTKKIAASPSRQAPEPRFSVCLECPRISFPDVGSRCHQCAPQIDVERSTEVPSEGNESGGLEVGHPACHCISGGLRGPERKGRKY